MSIFWYIAVMAAIIVIGKAVSKALVAGQLRREAVADERSRVAAMREDAQASKPRPATGPTFPSEEEQVSEPGLCQPCQTASAHQCSGDAECPCCQRTADASAAAAMREKVATALTGLGYTKAVTKEAVAQAWTATMDAEHENEQAMLKAALKQLR